jgi:hypothetical protein
MCLDLLFRSAEKTKDSSTSHQQQQQVTRQLLCALLPALLAQDVGPAVARVSELIKSSRSDAVALRDDDFVHCIVSLRRDKLLTLSQASDFIVSDLGIDVARRLMVSALRKDNITAAKMCVTKEVLFVGAPEKSPLRYPLHTAVQAGAQRIIEQNVLPPQFISSVDADGRTALDLLARPDASMPLVRALLKLGCVVTWKPRPQSLTAEKCRLCASEFGIFRYRYFCEYCGHTVCSSCSQSTEIPPRLSSSSASRHVCSKCRLGLNTLMEAVKIEAKEQAAQKH